MCRYGNPGPPVCLGTDALSSRVVWVSALLPATTNELSSPWPPAHTLFHFLGVEVKVSACNSCSTSVIQVDNFCNSASINSSVLRGCCEETVLVAVREVDTFPTTKLPELGPSMGLGGLSVSCCTRKAVGATEGCVDEIFVAIPSLLHRLPTGLICSDSHLSQKSSINRAAVVISDEPQ